MKVFFRFQKKKENETKSYIYFGRQNMLQRSDLLGQIYNSKFRPIKTRTAFKIIIKKKARGLHKPNVLQQD